MSENQWGNSEADGFGREILQIDTTAMRLILDNCKNSVESSLELLRKWSDGRDHVSKVPPTLLIAPRKAVGMLRAGFEDAQKNRNVAAEPQAVKNISTNISRANNELYNVSLPILSFITLSSVEHQDHAKYLSQRLLELEQGTERFRTERQELLESVAERKDTLEDIIKSGADRLQGVNESVNRATDIANKAYSEALDKTQKVKQESDDILRAAKQLVAEKAAASFTHSFHETAGKWRTNSLVWLGVTAIMIIATGSWAYQGLFVSISTLHDIPEIIQYFSARFLITALLISAVWWSAKQYRIAMHQKTINQHKADALRSFEAFIGATNAPDVRDAVILQTSQTIYGQEATGYLDGQGEGSIEQYTKVAQSINSAAQIASKSS